MRGGGMDRVIHLKVRNEEFLKAPSFFVLTGTEK